MDYIPLLRVCDLLPFLAFLKRIGTPVEKLLHAAKVPSRALDQPEALLPVYPVHAFLERAMRAEGLPHLGALVGGDTAVERFGAFSVWVLQSPTLHEALATVERGVAAFDASVRIWRERRGDRVWVRLEIMAPASAGLDQALLYGLRLLVNLVQRAAGPAWTPDGVHLPMRDNRELAELEGLFGAPLRFGRPACAVVLPAALLSRPLPALANARAGSDSGAREALQATAPALDLAGSLEQLLRLQILEGRPDIQCVAEAAGLQVRTLQRRLKARGLQYSRLLEKTRFALAIELLEDPGFKVIDIAHELGYGNPANFTRAFQRWTGVAPREFRQRHCTENP